MQNLLDAFNTLFTFLVNALGTIAGFFTSNVIGQIILGIAIFSVVVNIVISIINKLK